MFTIQSKFKIGQEVWTLYHKKAVKFRIYRISCSLSEDKLQSYLFYERKKEEKKEDLSVQEEDLYGSLDELKQAIFGDCDID